MFQLVDVAGYTSEIDISLQYNIMFLLQNYLSLMQTALSNADISL